MKQTLPDRVVYTLSVPRASSRDSGVYECSVTRELSGETKVGSVAVAVSGESAFWIFTPKNDLNVEAN